MFKKLTLANRSQFYTIVQKNTSSIATTKPYTDPY